MWRRALQSQMIAATRLTAARWRKHAKKLAPGVSLDTVRQVAQEASERQVSAMEARIAPRQTRIIGIRGENDAQIAWAIPALGVLNTPAGAYMTSANCLARDFYANEFTAFCKSIAHPRQAHRRMWEYAFIAHHLQTRGMVGADRRALALSPPEDPLPGLFAESGCQVDHLRDTTALPGGVRYDLIWSVGAAFPGSQAQAIADAVALVGERLADGGVAVFTADFNLSVYALAGNDGSAFTRDAVERLVETLSQQGHHVAPLPFELGLTALDSIVDLPPYSSGAHLKILQDGFAVTSFGLVVVRNAGLRKL